MLTAKSWTLHGKIKEYFVWIRRDKGKAVYNITKGGQVDDISGGYYRLDSLLKLKGLY